MKLSTVADRLNSLIDQTGTFAAGASLTQAVRDQLVVASAMLRADLESVHAGLRVATEFTPALKASLETPQQEFERSARSVLALIDRDAIQRNRLAAGADAFGAPLEQTLARVHVERHRDDVARRTAGRARGRGDGVACQRHHLCPDRRGDRRSGGVMDRADPLEAAPDAWRDRVPDGRGTAVRPGRRCNGRRDWHADRCGQSVGRITDHPHRIDGRTSRRRIIGPARRKPSPQDTRGRPVAREPRAAKARRGTRVGAEDGAT